MRGIREERLKAILHNQILTPKTQSFVQYLIEEECSELQEPWMTLDEFLKSGFEGLCWIALTNKFVFECRYQEWDFIVKNGCVNYESITHVMPIHKPEPPR